MEKMRLWQPLKMKVKIIAALLLFVNYTYAQNSIRVAKVISVYDGDTFKVDLECDCEMDIVCKNISIRVLGIDAPEIRGGGCEKEKQLATKARDFAKAFLSQGEVRLQNIDRGKYFRILADVFVNGKSLSKELVKRELAVPYDGGTKIKDWCATE